MPQQVKPIPDGYHAVTPYLFIKGATQALDFYKNVFAAVERMCIPGPNNTIGHAEISINGSVIMLADECPSLHARSPQSVGGTPVMIYVYMPDVDAVVAKALAAGAKLLEPVQDKFYGDRSGSILDPFGHLWGIATHKEDVSQEELQRRLAEMNKKAGA
jgi:PhnB protein